MREPRILLVRPDHLGDVLLTLPAAAALKRSLPSAHLTYLVAAGLEAVVDRCPFVDETLSLPYPPPDAVTEPSEWEVLPSAAIALRDRFDVAALLRPLDPWSGTLVHAAGIPIRVGFSRGEMVPFLTHTVGETAHRHAVMLALDLVTAAFGSLDGSIPRGVEPPAVEPADQVFVPTHTDHAHAEAAIERVKDLTGTRPLIVHPGTGWKLKNWPPERWGRLAAGLQRRLGVRPLVTGGSSEQALVMEVVGQSQGSSVPLVPPLSVGAFAALLSRAALVVASDSGPVHLAALVGTPVVGLYGPGDPALAAPWCPSESRRIVRIDLPCSPCGVMHDPPCGALREPACVTGVSAESVLEAVDSLRAACRLTS